MPMDDSDGYPIKKFSVCSDERGDATRWSKRVPYKEKENRILIELFGGRQKDRDREQTNRVKAWLATCCMCANKSESN